MKKIFLTFILIITLNLASAAHYIVGYVNDARDETPANEHSVVLWNPIYGNENNLTDVIGPTGNSGTDNIYMIDCEMLNNPCNVGDTLNVRVYDTGDGYISETKSVVVTGAGYTVLNLTLNSPPVFELIQVDDSISSPIQEIDLNPATTTNILCRAIVSDESQESILNSSAVLFHSLSSSYNGADLNINHYTNNSCYLNKSYGTSQQAEILCEFEIWYYASSGTWNCTIKSYDNLSTFSLGSNTTNVNKLLSIGIESPVDYGEVTEESVSDELEINITNYGNVRINLSLSGFAVTPGDELAMNCTAGSPGTIDIHYQKFNLTHSNPQELSFQEFNNLYENLTSESTIKSFNLASRENDLINDAYNKTYWRIYTPSGVGGSCQGNIVFGAIESNEN